MGGGVVGGTNTATDSVITRTTMMMMALKVGDMVRDGGAVPIGYLWIALQSDRCHGPGTDLFPPSNFCWCLREALLCFSHCPIVMALLCQPCYCPHFHRTLGLIGRWTSRLFFFFFFFLKRVESEERRERALPPRVLLRFRQPAPQCPPVGIFLLNKKKKNMSSGSLTDLDA